MIKALGVMWRAWAVVVPVVLVNAALQALLTIGDPVPGPSAWFIIATVLSFAILVIAYALIAVAMLQAATGRVSFATTVATSGRRMGQITVWSALLLAVVIAGLLLYVVPGLLVLAAFPYLLIAVADGDRTPIPSNFRAIGRHRVRWLLMTIAMAVWCLLLWLLTALNTFFTTGPLAAFISWIVLGLFASWFTCAWARVWRIHTPTS